MIEGKDASRPGPESSCISAYVVFHVTAHICQGQTILLIDWQCQTNSYVAFAQKISNHSQSLNERTITKSISSRLPLQSAQNRPKPIKPIANGSERRRGSIPLREGLGRR